MADSLHIVMLGAPGSGKGTQAATLAESLGIPAISTGDMLRAAVAAQSELGQRVESTMASGALVGDDLMAEVVKDRLAQEDAQRGFILDGYPRTLPQADTLAGILDEASKALDHVVLLEVPEEVLIERSVQRGRGDDDREEVVRERQRVYREATEPLVSYYDSRDVLRRVDGDQDIDAVTSAIAGTIGAQG